MAKTKTNHTSTEVLKLENGRTIYSMAKSDVSLFFPEKESWRQRLIYTLYEWAERETSVEILQFLMEFKIPRSTFYDWRNAHPDIKDAIDECKLWLSCRRRVGALNKKYDKDVVFKDMFTYDPEWKEVDTYNQALKVEPEPRDIFIKLSYVKSSPEVPELPVKEELETTEPS